MRRHEESGRTGVRVGGLDLQATTDGGDDESPARGGSAEEATQDFGVCTQTQEFESCAPGSRKLQIFSYAAAEVVCSQYCSMPLPKCSAVSRVESRRVRRRLVAYQCDGTAVRCGSEAADAARQAEAREIVGLQRRRGRPGLCNRCAAVIRTELGPDRDWNRKLNRTDAVAGSRSGSGIIAGTGDWGWAVPQGVTRRARLSSTCLRSRASTRRSRP